MKHSIPFLVILTGLALTLISIFGENGFSKMKALEVSLSKQKEKNEVLKGYVGGLRQDIVALQRDDRALEKAARNDLGLARPDEMIFFFEDKKAQ